MIMRHTDNEIDEAARRFERFTDELDPETNDVDRTDDLRAIADASSTLHDDEARVREAVEVARARGRSWNQIAVALGVSRQAARQKYANKVA